MSLYQRIAELERQGEPAAVVTVIRTHGSVPRRAGSRMLVLADGSIEGTIGGGTLEQQVIGLAQQAIREGKVFAQEFAFRDPEHGDVGVCGGEMEVYVEPLESQPTIVVVGAGHVGAAVAELTRFLGYRLIVCDDRPGFATPEKIPGAQAYFECSVGEIPRKMRITPRTYLVLTTRGVDLDVEGLPALIESEAAYIGVIGSRRRWETTAAALIEQGVAPESLARVTSPIGLELNAETPEEIAVSIMAEILLRWRGGTGEPMAHRPVAGRKHKGA